jgi:hypothetical protein
MWANVMPSKRYELKMLFFGSEFHTADPSETMGAIHRSQPHFHIGGPSIYAT